VPVLACTAYPTRAVPVIFGSTVARGDAPLVTDAIAADTACADAWPGLVAVTVTVSRLPSWDAVTTYVAPAQPELGAADQVL
jgi:hypothetical protein